MIIPEETFREMLRDISTVSSEFVAVLKNLQPRPGADVERLLTAAKAIRDKLHAITHALIIVSEENAETKNEPMQ